MPINTPAQITVPFATSGLKNTIPSSANPVTGNAGFDQGFPAITMTPKTAGGIPPFGQDFNGILFAVTEALRFMQAGGNYPYSSSFSTAVGGYPIGAVVNRADSLGSFRNLVANNTANPETGGAGWVNASPSTCVGQSLNLKCNVTTVSASANFSFDELCVGASLGGVKYMLPASNRAINLATVGAGGMDVGSAPASSFVGMYVIFNPLTGLSALLGVSAAAVLPKIYGGSNMPSGYTASALVSVWQTNASSQFVVGYQAGSQIVHGDISVLSVGTVTTAYGPVAISGGVPQNAKTVSGLMSLTALTGSGGISINVASDIAGIGRQGVSGFSGSTNSVIAPFKDVVIVTPQLVYFNGTVNTITSYSVAMVVNGYSI